MFSWFMVKISSDIQKLSTVSNLAKLYAYSLHFSMLNIFFYLIGIQLISVVNIYYVRDGYEEVPSAEGTP